MFMFNEMMLAEVWLQENFRSQRGIEDLASRLGYSTSQIRRKFKEYFGISPSAYRDVLRLEMAARLLALTPLSISVIAHQCGYRNHSAFSRAFSRHYGQSPRQYRRTQRLTLRHLNHHGDPPDFAIRWQPPCQALVTRLYQPQQLLTPANWAQYASGADTLPSRLQQAPAVAVLHSLPLPSALERVDVGPLITQQTAARIAIPPAFRLVELPAQQYACVELESADEIPSAVQYLISRGLQKQHCFASGEAAQVRSNQHGLELQLPLLPKVLNAA
jgi:AraC family transcriptional regulator